MKRKRTWLLLLAIPVLGLSWLLLPGDRIGPRSYARIRLGMTQEEVEAIIGLPPGDYCTFEHKGATISTPEGEARIVREPAFFMAHAEGENTVRKVDWTRRKVWRGDAFMIHILVGDNGRVVGRSLWQGARRHLPLMEHIRSWLPW